jgi:hypothetical protein
VLISSLAGAAQHDNWQMPITETINQFLSLATSTVGGSVGAAVLGMSIIVATGHDDSSFLWHEFWHVATDQNDLQLVQGVISPNFNGTTAQASGLLTAFRAHDCKSFSSGYFP